MAREGGGPKTPCVLEGRYANYFTVGHNAVEFLLDFGQFYPEAEHATLHTRIITSPQYAMALLETLREAIERYEQSFGAISRVSEERPPRAG
jgi:hypothetical protein